VSIVDRLEDIAKAGKDARPLPQRVVRLAADYHRFPVPADRIREAMAEFAPAITAPVRKMQRVRAAAAALADRQSGRVPRRLSRKTVGWAPPPAAKWPETLHAIDLDSFESRIRALYHWAVYTIPDLMRGTANDVSDLADEELVTLLTVQDVAWTLELRRRFKDNPQALGTELF
jgi:hypothetical protein